MREAVTHHSHGVVEIGSACADDAEGACAKRLVDGADLATTRDNHAVMAAEDVDRLLVDLQSAVTTPAALKRTGIPRLHLRSMIADGYLKTLTRSNDVAYAKHRFALRDLDDLMDRMFEGAEEVEKPLPRQVDLQRARAIAICSQTDLLRLIFDGKLTWKGRLADRRDYKALLVDADEVRGMLPKGPAKTGLTKAQVQEVIRGMGQLSVPIFMESGHLESFMETDPITKRTIPVVTVESAEDFRRRYVSLGELCQDTGLHRSQVDLIMRAKGIPEVFDKASFETAFYDRAKVEKAEAEDRAFWRYDKAGLLRSLKGWGHETLTGFVIPGDFERALTRATDAPPSIFAASVDRGQAC